MNKRFVLLLVFSPLVISSCSLMSVSDEKEFVPVSSISSSDNQRPDVEFSITSAAFTNAEGNLLVNYVCNYASPFAIAGHDFSKMTITGVVVEEIDTSIPGRFSLVSPVIDASLKFEFIDIFGKTFISYRYNDVKLYNSDTTDIDYPSGYNTLYWSDEFNGDSLNSSNWSFEIGDGSPSLPGWGNSELEYYTDNNHTVSDGVLTISAKKQDLGGCNYTSTRIKTMNKVHFTYGYVEARIALPPVTGMWPAFWMMPNNSVYGGWPNSGEIDIMEARGRINYESSSAIHFSQVGGGHNYLTEKRSGHNIALFHKYAVEWLEDAIRFYVDDNCYATFGKNQWSTNGAPSSTTAPFDQDFYIILNLAVGGHFDGYQTPPEDFVSADMKVDYVRVFK